MKRTIKNIIMLILLIISFSSIVLTMFYIKNNYEDDNEIISRENIPNNSNNSENPPPEIPNDEGEMTEPPEMPNEGEMGERPEKPNEEGDMGEPPTNQKGEQANNGDLEVESSSLKGDISLEAKYYYIFIAEALVTSIIISYLLVSNFNQKSLKEVLIKDKIIIFILLLIILTSSISYTSILLTNKYFITTKDNNSNQSINTPNSNSNVTYQAVNEITTDEKITSGTYQSTNENENVFLITGNIDVTLSNIEVIKSGDSDGGDNTSFYGINSAILASNGANLFLENINVTTNATGANGVFSYGGSATTNNTSSDGTTITIKDSTIKTTKDNSGGLMTTGGGILNASNLTITTEGTSSAAIRTDRGGGTVNIEEGTYTTNGQGSPAVYSTAKVNISNAKLISNTSEGIVIEGSNSVYLEDCTLVDNNTKLNGLSTTYKNIFLYQSMSGDAAEGTSTFISKNSSITTNKGDTFYVTNTTSTITLENNKIINNDSTGNLLRIQKDSWGKSGSNGGNVTLNLTNQDISGNIVVDEISSLTINIEDNSSYKGTINHDNLSENITLKIDSTSNITLTNDTYITSLDNEDNTNNNINFNGYKLYVNGKSLN